MDPYRRTAQARVRNRRYDWRELRWSTRTLLSAMVVSACWTWVFLR